MSRVTAKIEPLNIPEDYLEVSELSSESTDLSEFTKNLSSIANPPRKHRRSKVDKRKSSDIKTKVEEVLEADAQRVKFNMALAEEFAESSPKLSQKPEKPEKPEKPKKKMNALEKITNFVKNDIKKTKALNEPAQPEPVVQDSDKIKTLKKKQKRELQKAIKQEKVKATPTPKEIIKLQTEGLKKIKASSYDKVEPGTFIKHINAAGKLSTGGYIWYKSIEEKGDKTRKFWRVGTVKYQGEGGMHYPVFWENVKAVYIKQNTRDKEINNALIEKDKAIRDLSGFLFKKHGKEFKDYIANIIKSEKSSSSQTSSFTSDTSTSEPLISSSGRTSGEIKKILGPTSSVEEF